MTIKLNNLHARDTNEVLRDAAIERLAVKASEGPGMEKNGYAIILAATLNNGSSSRYGNLTALGDTLANELAMSDIGFAYVDLEEVDGILAQLDSDMDGEQLLELDVRVFFNGRLIHFVSTEAE